MKKNGLHIDTDGNKHWYKDDLLHRLDGPATEWVWGTKQWWADGKRHRTDGPAIEHFSGHKAWHMDGIWLGDDNEGFWALWDLLTDEQRNNLNLLMHLPKI